MTGTRRSTVTEPDRTTTVCAVTSTGCPGPDPTSDQGTYGFPQTGPHLSTTTVLNISPENHTKKAQGTTRPTMPVRACQTLRKKCDAAGASRLNQGPAMGGVG
jgi:hypothetical protein